jgi:ABC-type antimicrobial peptide transport system permease subunit
MQLFLGPLFEYLAMVIKNLLRRKIRTLLTVVGISVGVAAIIGLGTLADGLQAGYSSMLSGTKADLILSQPDAYDISFSSIDEEVGVELAAMPEVSAVSGMLQGWAQAEDEPFFFVFGHGDDSFVLDRFQIVAGVGLDSREANTTRGKPLLLGSAAAEVFMKKPGDNLRVSGSIFRIIGLYQTGDAFEDSGAVLRLQDAQELTGKPRLVSVYYIKLKDPDQQERLITRVERKWSDLSISGLEEYASNQLVQEMLQAYVWVIGGLAILMGGVGMMNAQLMAVNERTREIGVLRAVGWSRRRVLSMILGESLLVSILGGMIGVAIGWLLLFALSSEMVVLGLVSTNISSGLLVQAFFVVVVLGLVGGLYPAWRASRLEPVVALQYEGGSGGKTRRLPVGGMALQSLWQRSLRTLLTLAAIGLTVGSILALEVMIGGMAASMNDWAFDTEIMIRQADIADTGLSTLDERVGDRIEALPEVENVTGLVFTAVVLPDAGSFFILQGYPPNSYAIRRFTIVDGAPLRTNRQVILGRTMADAMHKEVGDTIELSGTRFKIAGIFESQVGWDEMGGVVSLRDGQIMAGKPRKVSMYAVKLHDPAKATEIVDYINTNFPDAHASVSGEFAEQMPDFENMDGMINGISFLAILIAGVGVLNTMLMSVFERTREIGVLRSLGWRRRTILGMILKEALWLGIFGGLAGVAVAFGFSYLLTVAPMIGELIEPLWEWDILVRALVVALLLGVIGGLYPAYRATRLQPVEALRYE